MLSNNAYLGKQKAHNMTQTVEQLILDRDEALKHYEYCLEHYGETDEDTIQSENDYNTLESQVGVL